MAARYGYTPDQIADMSPARQIMLLRGKPSKSEFNTEREMLRYLTGKRSV